MVSSFEFWLRRLVCRREFPAYNARQLKRGVSGYADLPGIVFGEKCKCQPHLRLDEDGNLVPGRSDDGLQVVRVPRHMIAMFPSTVYKTEIGGTAQRLVGEHHVDFILPPGSWAQFVAVNDAYQIETAWGRMYQNSADGEFSIRTMTEEECWPVVDGQRAFAA